LLVTILIVVLFSVIHIAACLPVMTAGPRNKVMGRMGRACCREPREEAGYPTLSTHLCPHSRAARDSDSERGVGECDANLQPPCILHPHSPMVPSACLPSGSSSGFTARHLCWGAEPGGDAGGPGPHALRWVSPWPSCGSKGGKLWKKKHAEDMTGATNCSCEGYSRAMSCREQLLSNTSLDWI